jgi:energy-coupling factor transporter ATP-binding protein EcfA2
MPEHKAHTTIWQQLELWAASLSPWQRYVLATAVRERTLSEGHCDTAYKIFLEATGLVPKAKKLAQIPHSITGRPEGTTATPLKLSAICNLHNINALPNGARLEFGDELTIVYGANGAGKSGFTRILANACFSRARPKILPNVYAGGAKGTPSCDITVKTTDQDESSVAFSVGGQTGELLRFSVFDSSVARVHLSEQNSLGFTPVGFDIFAELIRCYREIERRLQTDIAKRRRENDFFKSFLEPASPVSRLVESLGPDTNLSELKKFAIFGTNERKRLTTLNKQIDKLKAQSVEQNLRELAEARADIINLRDRMRIAVRKLQPEAKAELQAELDEFVEKTHRAVTAGVDSFKTPYFQSTGGEEWQAFISAAKDLADAEHKNYPRSKDRCLLCHRTLDEPSITLMKRLWVFLEDESRAAVEHASKLLDRRIAALTELNFNFFDSETRVYGHLAALNPNLTARIKRILRQVESDRKTTIKILEAGRGKFTPKLHPEFTAELDDLRTQLDAQIETLKSVDKDALLRSLEEERITLRHRQLLNRLIHDIVSFVDDQVWVKRATTVSRTAFNTKSITEKERELFEKVIEEGYRARLSEEFDALNCALPLELQTHGRGGQTKRWLSIKGGHKPAEILSEGEQRAVALADFLAEVSLNPASAGIILDDPVNSQDHERKYRIASRLVREAKSRQTIVFTHDLVFLNMLIEIAEKEGVDLVTHWIQRDGASLPGQVALNGCPATTADYRTTKKARESLYEARAVSGQRQVEAVQRGMAELRRTIEEAIISRLFKNVVKRWDERVLVGSLKKINWSDDLADDIEALYGDISRYIEGHSHSEAYAGAPPNINELDQMICKVDALLKRATPDRVKA